MNNIFAVAGVVIKELYRRKDFYVLFILTALITLVMASVNFFNDDKIVRYLKEICLLLIWISSLVIAITTAARQIPAERESRTIFPLLAKPVTRAQVIAGKFLGCWLACGLALVVFYFFFGVVSASREHEWPLLNYFQALWMQWIFLGVVIAHGAAGSIIFAAPSVQRHHLPDCHCGCAGVAKASERSCAGPRGTGAIVPVRGLFHAAAPGMV